MAKQNIDWSSLGFGYMVTGERFVSNFKDGKWDDGVMTTDATVTMSECAGVLQYAQTVFEGLKAYETCDGKIVVFRPDLNASRFKDSCERLEMPVYPEEKFIEAVKKVVKANVDFVPPYGTGATLYLRPYMFGSNPVIGVKPADEYQFRLFATPVGPYFKGGAKPITIKVCDFDRAAPHGTGATLYLRPYMFGSNPVIGVKPADEYQFRVFATPVGPYRRSLMYVAEHYLGLEVEQREVYFDEVKDFAECGLCGTAAVISPVGKIYDHGKEICFPSGMEEMGPVTKKLYDTLTGIQMGKIEAPEGWIQVIE